MEFEYQTMKRKRMENYDFDTLKCPQRAENMNITLHQENAKYSYKKKAK